MELQRLWLTDFRSYPSVELSFAPGLTAIVGRNAQGKTNLLEAIAYLALLRSFRGAPIETLVRDGCAQAIVRAEVERDGRQLLIEAEINRVGRNRVLVNRQRLGRARELLGALRVTVFAPEDLVLVKGGPGGRREYLDDTLVGVRSRNDALRTDLERVLKQRNALLKQVGGRLDASADSTLAVWDAKFVEVGEAMADARAKLTEDLRPLLRVAYDQVAQTDADIAVDYRAPWRAEGLASGLVAARRDDLRRGVSTVGPHRDELDLTIGGLPARTHASQGEQRSLAWALRLAAHALMTEAAGSPPLLLLDDIFSELDSDRCAALLAHLPAGQTLLSTAEDLPDDARPQRWLRVALGEVREESVPPDALARE